MHKPYTYLLHHIPTNTFYYGVRWAKGCHPDEFWKKYFTSSDRIQLLRTLFGDESFQFEIRKTFKTGKEASKWECKVLKRMKVLQNQNIWINKTTNSAWLYDEHPLKGKSNLKLKGSKRSEETKRKISLSKIGKKRKPFSKDVKEKMSLSKIGIPKSESHKQNMTGKIRSLEHKLILKDLQWITDGSINKRVSKQNIIPNGWRKGRIFGWGSKISEAHKKSGLKPPIGSHTKENIRKKNVSK